MAEELDLKSKQHHATGQMAPDDVVATDDGSVHASRGTGLRHQPPERRVLGLALGFTSRFLLAILGIVASTSSGQAGSKGYLQTAGPSAIRIRQPSQPLPAIVLPPLDMGYAKPEAPTQQQTEAAPANQSSATIESPAPMVTNEVASLPDESLPSWPSINGAIDDKAAPSFEGPASTGAAAGPGSPAGGIGATAAPHATGLQANNAVVPPAMFLRFFQETASGKNRELILPVSPSFVPPQPLSSRPSTATYVSPGHER